MWLTVMVMAIAVSFEPFRVGMTVLMLNRPRPMLQLLAFLSGGFAMGTAVGLAVLFGLRHTPLSASRVTLPNVQIAIGAFALLIAVVLIFPSRTALPPTVPRRAAKLSGRVRALMAGGSLWVAAVAGLGIALPSVDYLATLAVILASRAPAVEQIAALFTFNLLAFALVEIPLLAFAFAPDKTLESMARLNAWIRSRRRRYVAALIGAVGCVLVAVGIAGL